MQLLPYLTYLGNFRCFPRASSCVCQLSYFIGIKGGSSGTFLGMRFRISFGLPFITMPQETHGVPASLKSFFLMPTA